jgi:hypothetical protein
MTRGADLLFVSAALVLCLAGRLFFGVMIGDDAYITFRYAHNLASHHALVFNAGEPVLGTSTPLFALLLAVPASLRLSLRDAAFLLGILSDLAILLVLSRMLREAGERDAARLAPLLIAVTPLLAAITSEGMETPLYSLLLVSAAFLAGRAGTHRVTLATGAALALVILVRPDGLLMAAAVCSALVLGRNFHHLFRVAIVTLVLLLPWLAFATWYYGSPIPQSVIAKAAGGADARAGWDVTRQYLLRGYYLPLTGLAGIGAWRLWRTRNSGWRALIAWWVLYVTMFSATGAFGRADWYFAPVLAPYFAFAVTGLVGVTAASRLRAIRAVPAGAVACAVILAALHWTEFRAALRHVRSIREDQYVATARDIERSSHPCNIAALEIGALGFASSSRIIDLGGLVTPAAVHMAPDDLLRRTNAQWLVVHNIWMPEALDRSPWFATSFRLMRRTALEPGRTLDVYERTGGMCQR